MSQDSTFKTVGVALGICLFCSLFVSVSAVKLAPVQAINKQLDMIENILQVADLEDQGNDPLQVYKDNIKPILIDLDTGKTVGEEEYDDKLNPEHFDLKAMADDPKYSETIPPDEDMARIKRRPKVMLVYLVMQGNAVEKVILPIYGQGLWSTLYGFLSLEKDLKTVSGITFYEHQETPGLGGEVDNPKWKASWKGKQALGDDLNVVIHVIKGQVSPGTPAADREIDGLSGATLTTRGVENLIQYWLGEHGYGPFFNHFQEVQSYE